MFGRAYRATPLIVVSLVTLGMCVLAVIGFFAVIHFIFSIVWG